MLKTGLMMPVDGGWARLAYRVMPLVVSVGWGATALAAEPQYDSTIISSTITIIFNDEGTLTNIQTGLNTTITGNPVAPTGTADAVPPSSTAQTPQFSVTAKEGMMVNLDGKMPGSSALAGGFTVDYGDAILTGERLDMNQSRFPGTAIDALEHGAIFGGPAALPYPGRVGFDSSKATLPRFSFRGLVQAAQVNMDRKEIAPTLPAGATAAAPVVDPPGAPPRIAHYHVTMTEVGDFAGDLRSQKGWAYYTGWCDHAEADLAAEVTAKGLANMRLQKVILYGSTTPDGHPRRLAEIHRPQQSASATRASPAP
jgi:hypothetical protein